MRLGAGNLKSLVVLICLGLAAYMTLKGLFGIWRTRWIDPVAMDLAAHGVGRQDLPTLVAGMDRRKPQRRPNGCSRSSSRARSSPSSSRIANSARASTMSWAASWSASSSSAGWYVTGHLGYRRESRDPREASSSPPTAAPSSRCRSWRRVALHAGAAHALDRQVAGRHVRDRGAAGVDRGVVRVCDRVEDFPLGRPSRHRGHREPRDRAAS